MTKIRRSMNGLVQDVLSGIKAGEGIEGIQDALDIEDDVMFSILIELVRLGKVNVTVA